MHAAARCSGSHHWRQRGIRGRASGDFNDIVEAIRGADFEVADTVDAREGQEVSLLTCGGSEPRIFASGRKCQERPRYP